MAGNYLVNTFIVKSNKILIKLILSIFILWLISICSVGTYLKIKGVICKYKFESWIYSPAVIFDNIAYQSTFNGKLYAISLNDKKTKWIFEPVLDDNGATTPVILGNSIVFSGTDTYVLNINTGRQNWRYRTLTMYSAQ